MASWAMCLTILCMCEYRARDRKDLSLPWIEFENKNVCERVTRMEGEINVN